MENQQIPDGSSSLDNFFNIAFDESTRAQVRKAAQWARICTLCAFIGYGIALIVAFFGKQVTIGDSEAGIQINNTLRTTTIISSLITIGIGVWINYWLYRFATSAAKGMEAMDSFKTNEGFDSLRRYFKLLGILLIIGLSLAVLFILFNLFR
jgi:hypothetical protein